MVAWTLGGAAMLKIVMLTCGASTGCVGRGGVAELSTARLQSRPTDDVEELIYWQPDAKGVEASPEDEDDAPLVDYPALVPNEHLVSKV
ncbi:hypothetical protein PENSPDRAFT_653199 [Peniophora sp. CONT]|nr:hypothetical protein PENSPDRAFT_653199 [Peniophora sp. CONT]